MRQSRERLSVMICSSNAIQHCRSSLIGYTTHKGSWSESRSSSMSYGCIKNATIAVSSWSTPSSVALDRPQPTRGLTVAMYGKTHSTRSQDRISLSSGCRVYSQSVNLAYDKYIILSPIALHSPLHGTHSDMTLQSGDSRVSLAEITHVPNPQ